MEQKIVIISDTQSYIVLSLKEKMEEMGYEVVLSKAEYHEVQASTEGAHAILIYSEASIVENSMVLHQLKDICTENDELLFVIGTPEELSKIEGQVGEQCLQQKYIRPINVKELVDSMNKVVKGAGTQGKKKILVVDDSGAMLRNVKGWLEDKYQVALANSGAMAIKYLALNRPDLVLLDYEMPIIDGRQVLQMIRNETDFADVPVIFLTSKGDRQSVMDVMELKPEGYLLKSMEPSKIVAAVDSYFAKQEE